MKTPEELADEYAFNIFKERYESLDYEEKNVYANAVIAFLAAYQAAAPQWISVKDRLPEIEEVRDDYKRSKCALWIDYDKDIVVGYHLTIGDRTRVMTRFSEPRISNFTHWMPLPEPPKEDE